MIDKNIKVLNYQVLENGFYFDIDISMCISYNDFLLKKDFLRTSFKCDIELEYFNSYVRIYVIQNSVKLNYKFIDLPNYQLLLGYDFKLQPIIADMKICPHLLISGLPGQGKSSMLKQIISNLKECDVILFNAYEDDFKGYRIINNLDSIKSYFSNLRNNLVKKKKVTYLIIDELGLITDKQLLDDIKFIMQVARHYKIYIVGVIQLALKENIKFKQLFSSRVSFKQIDTSCYVVSLNTNITDILEKQQFFYFGNVLVKGTTYIL
ncbi:MAG: AAA family ATPase [Methanobacteriaceae archaeon]|nr:AAA family ATPase [Methanobacteriaceae archaeon]